MKKNKKQPEEQFFILDHIMNELDETQKMLLEANKKLANKNIEDTVRRHCEVDLIKQLGIFTRAAIINPKQIEKIMSELEKLYGIESQKPNHCKYCLFQKLCHDFTLDGRNGLTCSFVAYNEGLRKNIKEAIKDGMQVYDKSLIYWKDTQEQFDKRFILS